MFLSMFSLKLDIKLDRSNVLPQKKRAPLMSILSTIKNKVMNFIRMLTRRESPVEYVGEERHFKKSGDLYVSKKTSTGSIEMWRYSTVNVDDFMFLGTIRGKTWIKPKDYYTMYYREQKYAELLFRIIVEKWQKPYRLAELEAKMIR